MMTRRKDARLAVLAAATFLFAACSDDNPTQPQNGTLTQQEAIAVLSEITSAALSAGEGPMASMFPAEGAGFRAAVAPSPASAFNLDIDIDDSVACENGGVIDVDGTLAIDVDDDENGSWVYEFVQTPKNCVVVTEEGPSYKVNGKPSIQMSGSFAISEGEPSGVFEMSFAGGFEFDAVNGGATGSCTMDLTYLLDWNSMLGSAEGRICGYDVDEQF